MFQTQKGYGNAIIEGLIILKQSIHIFYADGSTDPKYILPMLDKLKIQNLDLVFGSRYEKNAHSFDDDIITRIGNYGFHFSWKFFYEVNISDLLFTYIFAKQSVLKI